MVARKILSLFKNLSILMKTFPWSSQCPRVLMYHSFGDDIPEAMPAYLRVRPADFEKQIIMAKKLGYRFVTASELVTYRGRKRIAITFDDGYADNFECAYPIIKKHNVKATVFITSVDKMFDCVAMLSPDQLDVLAKDPRIEIGAHTANHILLDQHEDEIVRSEILESKKYIESFTKRPCESFAYPGGHFEAKHVVILKECGIKCAFTIVRGLEPINDPYRIHRVNVSRFYGKMRFFFLLVTGF